MVVFQSFVEWLRGTRSLPLGELLSTRLETQSVGVSTASHSSSTLGLTKGSIFDPLNMLST